jgi:hypothetical protein
MLRHTCAWVALERRLTEASPRISVCAPSSRWSRRVQTRRPGSAAAATRSGAVATTSGAGVMPAPRCPVAPAGGCAGRRARGRRPPRAIAQLWRVDGRRTQEPRTATRTSTRRLRPSTTSVTSEPPRIGECCRFAGAPYPPTTPVHRRSQPRARLLIVRSVVRIHPELSKGYAGTSWHGRHACKLLQTAPTSTRRPPSARRASSIWSSAAMIGWPFSSRITCVDEEEAFENPSAALYPLNRDAWSTPRWRGGGRR